MVRVFARYLAFRKIGAVVAENILLVCCILEAARLRLGSSFMPSGRYPLFIAKAFAMAVIFQLALHLRDIYSFRRASSNTQFFLRLAEALALASVLLSATYYTFPDLMIGRGIFAITLALVSVFLTLWHTLARVYRGARGPLTSVLIVGTGPLARDLVAEILRHPEMGIGITGFVDDDPCLVEERIVNPRVLGLTADLTAVAARHRVDHIVVGLHDRRGRLPIGDLLSLKMRGVAIEDATSLYERISGKIAIQNLKPSWMIFNAGFEVSRRMLLQKRILSVVLSSALLILLAPLLLLILLVIRLESRGPALHRQQRVGMGGRVFILWKFRTTREDAEDVTRVGMLLRRTRLDELPKLFNVLRGDMSLVGPRPERPPFVAELSAKIPFYNLRHAVKPGITGWAQINCEYGDSPSGDAVEKLQYELFYVKHVSLLLDLLILFQTVKLVLLNRRPPRQ
jgi:sugar transferase (PEP-CTERM system associated)